MSANDAGTAGSGQVIGILLAAGRGRRFDATGRRNKLLQCLADGGGAGESGGESVGESVGGAVAESVGGAVGESVAVLSARPLLACLPRVLAVVPSGSAELAAMLENSGCEVTMCADADGGMGHSLAHAVRHSQAWAPAGWLIALADMPWVQLSTVQAVLAAVAGNPSGIVAPCWQGQRGNPVFIPRQYQADLLALHGDQGARALLQRYPPHLIAVEDAGIVSDIDTVADLGKTALAKLKLISNSEN